MRAFSAGALMFCMAASASHAQSLPMQKYMPLDVAIEAAVAAVEACKAAGHPVSVEVMNHNGMTLAAFHDPFSSIHSAYSAHAKAYTVLSYSYANGEPTSALIAKRILASPAAVARIQGIPGLILAPGGVLIKSGDQTVGAIGVGGSAGPENDEKCAFAGVEKIRARLEAK